MSDAVVLRDVFRVHSTSEGDAAALQGLSLRIGDGEVLGVVGPSGSGKTTLLRILAGLDRPSAGGVRVFGAEVPRLSPRALARHRAETVGWVDQHHAAALDPDLRVRELVALRLRLDGGPASVADVRAHELLERVGLGGRADARPFELSGGEQQRVAVCAALAHRPRLLLADEPTGELDRDNADALFGLIRELAAEHRATAVVVTHDPRAAGFVDRVVHIRDGRVSEELHRQEDGGRIVVGRGGWLRLPHDLLREAGIRDHAHARVRRRELVLTSAGVDAEVDAPQEPDRGPADVLESPAANEPVVELRGLTKRYGARVVLDALGAEFERGALHAVTGPSGSGKTTLLNVVAGLELPTAGSVSVVGREVAALDRADRAALRRDAVGYVAQHPGLLPFLSAAENVTLALRVRGRDGSPALEALAAVGLADRAEQRVERLSGGERLRVAIARAVAPRPPVLLADEPTSRLDEANALAVVELLGRLAREWRAAVIVASHDPVLLDRADRRLRLA